MKNREGLMDIKKKLDIAVASALEELSVSMVESIRNPLKEKTTDELIKELTGFVKELGFKKEEDRFEMAGKDEMVLSLEVGNSTNGKIVVNSVVAHVSEELNSSVETDSFTRDDIDATNLQRLKVNLASYVKKWEKHN
jgi:predicted RNase H-related nuclease YkuK (DUF458 family)